MPESTAILVAGAGGRVGGIGRAVVTKLRSRGLLVRALVHREDERAAELRATGAEVVSSATYRSNGCFAQLRRNIRLHCIGRFLMSTSLSSAGVTKSFEAWGSRSMLSSTY